MSTNTFFPPQLDQGHASANDMLSTRKQQLAHLKILQWQQQQVLQQMSHGISVVAPQPSVTAQDERDDRLSASALTPSQVQLSRDDRAEVFNVNGGVSQVNFSFDQNHAMFSHVSHPRPPVAECDYDTDPTELYLRVQQKDWDGVTARASTDPHEAGTWVFRKEADSRLRWRLLPLHAAIIFRAPEQTISALLFAFAPGAACKDDTGALPLHLALRNGCHEEVLHLLLLAYPQGADVPDRKGRTPLTFAWQSTHANREAYVRALERSPAYYAVLNATSLAPFGHPLAATKSTALPPTPTLKITTEPVTPFDAQAPSSCAASPCTDIERMSELKAELAKTQETSQVLVEHVSTLEAQLVSRNDTERFLATKIAHLNAQVKESNAELEAAEREVEAKRDALAAKDNERARIVEAEVVTLKAALADKKDAELKSYRLTNKEKFTLEDQVAASERERAAAQASSAVLEAQLAQRIATEQSLASQVSTLACQLASSAASSSDAAGAYERRYAALADEQGTLKGRVAELRGKLGTVAAALDAMTAEQACILTAVTRHEGTMASCAKTHQIILQDATHQETLLADAADERDQIVNILVRQAEDAERTLVERERTLQAVKEQEADIRRCEQERDNVVTSVNKQREYMDFMLNGQLRFLKRTGSKDEKELANEGKVEDVEQSKSECVSQRVVMRVAERAASPASSETSAEAGLAAVIAEAAVIAGATEASETPVTQESGIDLTAVVAAALGTTEKPDDVPAYTAGTGDDKLRLAKVWETARAEDQEETYDTVDANEDTGAAAFVTGEEADDEGDVNERDITIGIPVLEIENNVLKEAANVTKEAMKAAENLVEQDGGEYGDGSSEDSENSLLGVTKMGPADHNDDELEEEEKEEEESPEDKEEGHTCVDLASYSTPASQAEDEEEATIDTIISAASSDDYVDADESTDSSHEKDEDETAIGADISAASSDDDGNDDESVHPLLQPPSSVE